MSLSKLPSSLLQNTNHIFVPHRAIWLSNSSLGQVTTALRGWSDGKIVTPRTLPPSSRPPGKFTFFTSLLPKIRSKAANVINDKMIREQEWNGFFDQEPLYTFEAAFPFFSASRKAILKMTVISRWAWESRNMRHYSSQIAFKRPLQAVPSVRQLHRKILYSGASRHLKVSTLGCLLTTPGWLLKSVGDEKPLWRRKRSGFQLFTTWQLPFSGWVRPSWQLLFCSY